MEATSTRRAGLERFTFPRGSKPYFALDLANDLPASWAGGHMDIDPKNGRITIGGFWGSRWVTGCDQTAVFLKKNKSFGPPIFNYQAFACYDITNGGQQTLDEYGIWTGDT